ncbi:hypothetical protein [Aquimarina celericrescens]|uniref:Histidine kinase N-terminal 7TM region domain-containing protein n=1 Tax=Aquimarina celericrescens TaxID=1964542 RepID=A0ABW5B1N7_9FLAO
MREFFGIRNNALLFNLFYLISFTYLLNTYRLVIKDSVRKKIVKYSIGTYITLFTINGFYENYLIESQTIPFIMASSFLILSVIFYFVEILGTEKVLHTKKNLLFWISVGLLLFYAGSIPFRIALNYYAKAGGFNFLFAINYLLIIILNLCFIIGFIWSNKKQLY